MVRIEVEGLGRYRCVVPSTLSLKVGDSVVIECRHVFELGLVKELCNTTEPPEQEEVTILRRASEADIEQAAVASQLAGRAIETFREHLAEARSPVRALKARFSLRRERLALWYEADAHVDVRQVVGALQRQYATKIDAYQLDARDAAARMDGCGVCGRELCCSTWLCGDYPAVHVRMAKEQGLSMMPHALNGMCGKLKCCLRYEYDRRDTGIAS